MRCLLKKQVTLLPRLTYEYVRSNARALKNLSCHQLSGYTFDSNSNRKWYLEQHRFDLATLPELASTGAIAVSSNVGAMSGGNSSLMRRTGASSDRSLSNAALPSLLAFTPPRPSAPRLTHRAASMRPLGKKGCVIVCECFDCQGGVSQFCCRFGSTDRARGNASINSDQSSATVPASAFTPPLNASTASNPERAGSQTV